MFELLSAQQPFTGATAWAIQLALVAGQRPDLRTLVRDVPEDLIRVVDRLLEMEPERRYASADELIDALASFPVAATTYRRLAGIVPGTT
jgi:serine/threonine-protein kinase